MDYRALLFLGILLTPSALCAQRTENRDPPFEIVGPTFFALQVRDDAAAADWYRRAFDLEQLRHIEAADHRYSIRILKRGGLTVELIRLDSAIDDPDPQIGLFKVGFYVDDIDAAYSWLGALGTDMDPRILTDETMQARTFVLRDPEGNRLQIFARCTPRCEQ